MSSVDIEKVVVPKGLYQIISDMVKDILVTFPEEKAGLNTDLAFIVNNPHTTDTTIDHESIIRVYEFCKQRYPPHFLHIMYQNEELFNIESVELLPGMNFSIMWKLNISNTTKETIWKYLQLVLFNTISADLDGAINSNMFKDNSELNSKMADMLSNVQEYLSKQSDIATATDTDNTDKPACNVPTELPTDGSSDTKSDTEKVDMNKLLGGKLGEMAREIASESADLFSSENGESVGDALKNMLKNPSKMVNMFKNVGDKLESNLKSGKISETDMLMEASNVLKSLTSIPGFSSNGLMDMMKTMGGMGGGMGAMGGMGGINPLNGLGSLFASTSDQSPQRQQEQQQQQPKQPGSKNKHKRQLTVHERLQKKMLEKYNNSPV